MSNDGTILAFLHQKPMSTPITYHQKNRLLLGGTVVLLLVVYLVSIRPTLALYQSVSHLQSRASKVSQAPMLKQELTAELTALRGHAFSEEKENVSLLGAITSFCETNDLSIHRLPVADVFKEGSYTVESRQLVVEGRLEDILRLVYLIEYEQSLGVVSSLDLAMVKDRKTRKEQLTGTIVLRNIMS